MSIPNPVPGGTFSDSYGEPRSGGRRHAGVDIFAPRGAAVIAPVSGTVAVAGPDGGNGGNRVWIRGDDGRAYYFAHLDSIRAAVGQLVGVGTPIGTVGNTGNASSTSPHLHFSINETVGPERPVINPFLIIDRANRPQGSPGPVGPAGPAGNAGVISPATAAGDLAAGRWATNACLAHVPIPTTDGFCLITYQQSRRLTGTLAMVAGGAVMLTGALVLAAYGLQSAKARTALGTIGAPGRALAARSASTVAESDQADELDTRRQERAARQRAAQERIEAADAKATARQQRAGPRYQFQRPRAVGDEEPF